MTKKELEDQIIFLKNENQKINKTLKKLEKKIEGHLKCWFALPFFGFLVYQVMLQKRRSQPENLQEIIALKTAVAKNELTIAQWKKMLQKLQSEK